MNDGRIAAWISAWNRLETAQKILSDNIKNLDSVTPYATLLITQADIYTALADAPDVVGMGAGDWLVEEKKREEERDAMTKKRLDEMLRGR